MIATILGWILILMGILFFLKPQWLKNRMQKKGLKKLRKYMFLLLVSLGLLFMRAAWDIPGLLGKIILIWGILAIIKGCFLLKSKAAEKMLEWFSNQPLNIFRLGACIYLFLGIIILASR